MHFGKYKKTHRDLAKRPEHDNGPSEIPVTALHLNLKGTQHEKITTSHNKAASPILFDNHYYHSPTCMLVPGTPALDASARRVTWTFTKEHTSMSAAKDQESFLGVYCIWYKEMKRPSDPKQWLDMDGDFFLMKQLQWMPAAGETVVYEDVPEGMEVGMEREWWVKGVLLPKMGRVMRAGADDGERGAIG